MKKVYIVFSLSLGLAITACGGHESGTSADTTSAANKTAVATQTDVAQDTLATHNGAENTGAAANSPGAQLIAQSDCNTCHRENEKLVGPAFTDIAKKYSNDPSAVDSLANKIIKGGKGHWGDVPMTPHPTLAAADAQQMVKYILSLK